MSGSNRFSRGGGRGMNRVVHTPLGRGLLPLRRGQPAGAKDKESAMKGRGVALKGNSTGGGGSAVKNIHGEDFQLVSCQEQGAPPLYAMAIRLTPEMLETFKRLEEQGETPMMKFGVNENDNFIKAGEQEFRFTSAPEPENICDIFEEPQRGKDGNALLVEQGAVWRKLSVVRTLSASDKAVVKARSVEAERQQKARKSIVLDHNNSMTHNKAATAGDANGRRAPILVKGKKEPPQKKRKILSTPPVIPPLSVVKTRPMPPTAEKPPVPAVAAKPNKVSTPPDGPSILSRPPPSQGNAATPIKSKSAAAEEAGSSAKTVSATQKDKVPSPALAPVGETPTVAKATGAVNMSELRNCLITLLMDNSKGMTVKAVEKAVGEAMPNVRPDKKQIEKVIKAIASFHAPGKYMLKDGIEKGGFAKPSPQSGSSPETAPVDSPPLLELPALTENVPEARQEAAGAVGSGEDRGAPLRSDLKRADGTGRNSSLPLRGGEGAVSRAIRKAGEIVAEKQKSGTALGPSAHKVEDESLKESAAAQEVAVAEIDIGGDESPVAISTEHEPEGKVNGTEVTIVDEEPQNLASPHVLGAESKKEDADGDGSDSDSDSSSGSESGSGSGSDSESGSGTGSGSNSGSDSDSDAGSSSATEEENSDDEDVNIISDDEDKPDMAVVDTEISKARSRSNEGIASLERPERAQKQNSRGKKGQKLKGSDVSMTPHGSGDVDIGEGKEGGDISNLFDHATPAEKEAKGGNSEEEVNIVSCEEDTPSPPEERIASPAESGEHHDNAIDPEPVLETDLTEEGKGGQDVHATMSTRSGSESDHSIEEYETRAETSGKRGARVNAIGDQKDDTVETKVDGTEGVISPRGKASSRTPEEAPLSTERESRPEFPGLGLMSRGSDLSDGPTTAKEHLVAGGVPLRLDDPQKSLLGTPPVPRDGLVQAGAQRMFREGPGPGKGRTMEPKRKNVKTGDIQGKGPLPHRGPQRFNKKKSFGANRQTPGMASAGFSKPNGEPGLMGKGPEMRESFTVDRVGQASQDGDILARPEVQRRQNNNEAGLLGKPGKASELNRGKPGREPKQLKRPVRKPDGPRRDEHLDRAGASSEFGEKPFRETEFPRRPQRDGDPWWKSPRLGEPDSRMGSDSEAHSGRPKDLDSDPVDSLKFVSKMTSDLEQGELRNTGFGEDVRVKDPSRQEAGKSRESLDPSSRQPPNKLHVSSDKDKPARFIKKRSPADMKKQQQSAKKEQPLIADATTFSRENLRPGSGQKPAVAHDDRPEMGNSRTVEASRLHGDPHEKHVEGRNGKRFAEDAVNSNHDLGRPLKRTAFEQSQAAAATLGRGEPDSVSLRPEKVPDAPGRPSVGDIGRAVPVDGVLQHIGNSSRGAGDNGRVAGVKSRGQEGAADRDPGDKRGSLPDGKQKTTVGVLGPGIKKDLQSNGKKKSAQSADFYLPYLKSYPDLKGPISNYDQYVEYCNEYRKGYPAYIRLNTILESDKEDFQNFSAAITRAKQADDKAKLGDIYGKVRHVYKICSRRFKKMYKAFNILHDELKVIKQRCKEFADLQKP